MCKKLGRPLFSRFEALLKQYDKTPTAVAVETGIDPSMLTRWKNGVYCPKTEKLYLLAKYFGVSVDYFLEQEDEEA